MCKTLRTMLCILWEYLNLEEDINVDLEKTSSVVLGMSLMVWVTLGKTVCLETSHLSHWFLPHTVYEARCALCLSRAGYCRRQLAHVVSDSNFKMNRGSKNMKLPSWCIILSTASIRTFLFSVKGKSRLEKYPVGEILFQEGGRTSVIMCHAWFADRRVSLYP